MNKVLLAIILTLPVAIGGYVAAGPYLAIHGISEAIEKRDTAQLSRHVDFPALRINLKAQLGDYVVRRGGRQLQSSLLGAVALGMAGNLAGAGVDTLVTPAGIGALLQGQDVWKRATGDRVGSDTYAPPSPARPLRGARHRYDSLSQFSATTQTRDGHDIVFVLSRDGLRWRLSNIILPLHSPAE